MLLWLALVSARLLPIKDIANSHQANRQIRRHHIGQMIYQKQNI